MNVLSRNWGWVVLRGIVSILFGTLTLLLPGVTLAALVLLFGAYAFTDGVFLIVWAISNHRNLPRWPALVVGGVLGIAIGILTLVRPGLTASALLVTIAAWSIVIGILTLVAAFRLRREITGEWRLVLAGLLAVTLGVVLLAAPALGALAMLGWIGTFAIAVGVLQIAFGFQIRSWGRRIDHATLAARPA
jgi:uncharacterized membrane protein HdeD (DUF308 family)